VRQRRGVGHVPRPRLHPGPGPARHSEGPPPYAYLIYPHKPIVAYVPASGRLLSEYCVDFPDLGFNGPRGRLPASDDVLAKWMALTGDERRLINEANMHLPAVRSIRRASADSGASDVGARASLGRRLRHEPRSGERRQPRAAAQPHDPRGADRAAARSYLYGIGYSADDLAKPIIGIANTWTETMRATSTCAGSPPGSRRGSAPRRTPMEFNTVAVSDGITMGTEGMRTSLVSREVIADSIELVLPRPHVRRRHRDVGLRQDDPGTVMALARLNLPSLMLYGGSIAPGRYKGKDVTIGDVFEAVGAHGRREDVRRRARRTRALRLAWRWRCGGQFTPTRWPRCSR